MVGSATVYGSSAHALAMVTVGVILTGDAKVSEAAKRAREALASLPLDEGATLKFQSRRQRATSQARTRLTSRATFAIASWRRVDGYTAHR